MLCFYFYFDVRRDKGVIYNSVKYWSNDALSCTLDQQDICYKKILQPSLKVPTTTQTTLGTTQAMERVTVKEGKFQLRGEPELQSSGESSDLSSIRVLSSESSKPDSDIWLVLCLPQRWVIPEK